MTGSPDKERPLDMEAIERALEALSKRLRDRELRAHVYIVGGAAMILARRRSKATVDVDALMIDQRTTVLEAAREVARE